MTTHNGTAGRRWQNLHNAQMLLVQARNELRPGSADFAQFNAMSEALDAIGDRKRGIEQTRRGRSAKVGRWSC